MSLFIHRTLLRIGFVILCGLLLAVCLATPLSAEPDSLLAEGFRADGTNLPAGALVSLKQDDPGGVELADNTRSARLIGVVSDQAFLEVSDATSSVQVVMNGTAGALVSDLNGSVEAGDRITASPIAGVGMKNTQSGTILGIAQGSLSVAETTERTVTDENGRKQTVRIGVVPVQINVAAYIVPNSQSSIVPPALQSFVDGVAGKHVSPMRALIATLLVLLLFAMVTTLLYSAVRSSIISIGRNPLAETALRKSLLQVGATVSCIAVAGLGLVYLVLKL